ncbi:unnamed protein product, partial [Nesidiocoris tenuis]
MEDLYTNRNIKDHESDLGDLKNTGFIVLSTRYPGGGSNINVTVRVVVTADSLPWAEDWMAGVEPSVEGYASYAAVNGFLGIAATLAYEHVPPVSGCHVERRERESEEGANRRDGSDAARPESGRREAASLVWGYGLANRDEASGRENRVWEAEASERERDLLAMVEVEATWATVLSEQPASDCAHLGERGEDLDRPRLGDELLEADPEPLLDLEREREPDSEPDLDEPSSYFVQPRPSVAFSTPPRPNRNGQFVMGVKDSWLHNMETYKSNLEWLLGLSHHEFWSQIVYGSDTWDSVISFLQEGYPFYSIDHLPDDEHITLVYSQIYYLVFNVFKRAMTRKESEVNFIGKKYGSLLYNYTIISVPMMIDICAMYGHRFHDELTEMIASVFMAQPLYAKDLESSIQTIKTLTSSKFCCSIASLYEHAIPSAVQQIQACSDNNETIYLYFTLMFKMNNARFFFIKLFRLCVQASLNSMFSKSRRHEGDLMDLLNDKSFYKECESRFAQLGIIESLDDVYDDEYDDTYDDGEPPVPEVEEPDRKFVLPRVLQQARRKDEKYESGSELSSAEEENPESNQQRSLNFCENPEDVRERYQQKRLATMKRPPPPPSRRDVV